MSVPGSSDVVPFSFDDVEGPAADRVGDESMGFKQVMAGFNFSRALIGLQRVGPAQASLDEAW